MLGNHKCGHQVWTPSYAVGAVLCPWRVPPSQPRGRHHACHPQSPWRTPGLDLGLCSEYLSLSPLCWDIVSLSPPYFKGIIINSCPFPFQYITLQHSWWMAVMPGNALNATRCPKIPVPTMFFNPFILCTIIMWIPICIACFVAACLQ